MIISNESRDSTIFSSSYRIFNLFLCRAWNYLFFRFLWRSSFSLFRDFFSFLIYCCVNIRRLRLINRSCLWFFFWFLWRSSFSLFRLKHVFAKQSVITIKLTSFFIYYILNYLFLQFLVRSSFSLLRSFFSLFYSFLTSIYYFVIYYESSLLSILFI